METAKYVLNARKKLRLRQKDMATLLKVGQVNLCKYEHGDTMPPGDVILRIAELLAEFDKARKAYRKSA
ncbi:MAG: helix-turn-helix transcriptional regulator [Thermotogota bacterium]|nr:helix-turn-helix transcriptional regulator [Thermotogota bacterium]